MRKKIDASELLELVQKADMLERSLMLGADLVLIKYGKDGGIVRKTSYSYTPESLATIDAKLEKVAKKRRKKWESRYLEFAPLLPQLGWVMIPEDYGVRIIEAKDQGTEGEYMVTFLGYNELEIQHLSTLIADALLEDFEDKLAEETSETNPDGYDNSFEAIPIEEALDDFARRFNLSGAELQEIARGRGLEIIMITPTTKD